MKIGQKYVAQNGVTHYIVGINDGGFFGAADKDLVSTLSFDGESGEYVLNSGLCNKSTADDETEITVEFISASGRNNTNLKLLDNGEYFHSVIPKLGTRVLLNCVGGYNPQIFTVERYAIQPYKHQLEDAIDFEVFCPINNYGYVRVGFDEIERVLGDDEEYIAPPVPINRECDRCGVEYTVENEDEDEYLCPECAKRDYVTPYHRYTPKLKFYSTPKDKKDNLFLGVELETEYGGEYDDNAEEVVEAMRRDNGDPFVYVSHDSSLERGFEIITMPATANYHRSIENEYKSVFKKLVSLGYRGHNSNNAGIHVHFSRDFYAGENEELYITNLLYMIEQFWDEIIVFSRRDYSRSKTYMKKIKDDYSSDKSYIREFNKSNNSSGHHFAVNITNINTIELRMFKSTLNINTFMCIIDFVEALVRTAKEKSIPEIAKMSFEELLSPRALKYYKSRTKSKEFEEV